jgi:hypothetical protein
MPIAQPDIPSWHEKAGVRSDPRRTLGPDDISKDFFPRRLVPHLNHPLVLARGEPERRYLEAQHLYQWLEFTSHFEISVVNRATKRIAEGQAGFDVSEHTRMGAFKIYVDEGFHSLVCLDVRRQIEAASGIPALPYDFSPFLAHLDAVVEEQPGHLVLLQLLQVVVFETLVTAILCDIPPDPDVMPLIRATVRDHAADEGRHHVYFTEFFTHLWAGLEPAERRIVATALPQLIVRSLQPATRSARVALTRLGLTDAEVATVLADSYDTASVTAGIRAMSARTMSLFERCGVLDIAGASEKFATAGLIVC